MRFLTVALLLGCAMTSAKKMLELDGKFTLSKTNQQKSKLALNKRIQSYYGKGELPAKNTTQPVVELIDSDVVHHDNYFEKAMEDYYDVQLFSKIYVGSQRSEFDLILDTGSAWTWV